MATLKASFDAAVAASKQLPDKPDNMTMLKLYSLYKQIGRASCRERVCT